MERLTQKELDEQVQISREIMDEVIAEEKAAGLHITISPLHPRLLAYFEQHGDLRLLPLLSHTNEDK
jgi:hypothetical protein